MKKALLLISAFAVSGSLFAQTGNKNAVVNVENNYTPVYIEVGKKNVTPSIERQETRIPVDMDYSMNEIPHNGFTSENDILEVLPKMEKQYPGYVRLGYGITNDIDTKAAYRYNIGTAGTLKAFAAFDGFKGDVHGKYMDWNSRLFGTKVGVGYTHRFKPLTLDVDGRFGNSVFNYQNSGNIPSLYTDKQNEQTYGLTIGGTSNLPGAFSYNFKGDFGFIARSYSAGERIGIGEGNFGIGGGIGYEVYNKWLKNIGVDLNVEAFLYTGALKTKGIGYNDYFSIDFDPYMNLTFDDWQVKAGIKTNFVTKGASVLAVAPDIKVQGYLKENITPYGSITGGRESNSLADLSKTTPYWGIPLNGHNWLKPTYRIVDLNVGTRMSFSPISIDVNAGYAYTKDDLLQTMAPENSGSFTLMFVDFGQANTHHAYVSGKVGCDVFSWVKVSADARYDFWSCNNKDYLIMKPLFTANVNVEGRIIEHLTLQLGYNYTHYTKGKTLGRIYDKHDLYARVNYQINKRFGAYIQGNNLANCRFYEYAGYETRGIRGSLGATVNF